MIAIRGINQTTPKATPPIRAMLFVPSTVPIDTGVGVNTGGSETRAGSGTGGFGTVTGVLRFRSGSWSGHGAKRVSVGDMRVRTTGTVIGLVTRTVFVRTMADDNVAKEQVVYVVSRHKVVAIVVKVVVS